VRFFEGRISGVTRVSPTQSSILKAPLRVVSIGGGTGLSTLLGGLKHYARGGQAGPTPGWPIVDITAVVTVTDDGGSSGRLRREFDIPPPGDIRNCMTALSEDEHLLSHLFEYRFASGRGLKGHSFGNLFLAAMNEITGDFAEAVKLSSEILAIRGRIFPATRTNVTLEAELLDGTVVRGETNISNSRSAIGRILLVPENCVPMPETIDAIMNADLITFGPGSLYTSIVPNLLVKGLPDAIERSSAMKVYFVNLMWQPGETINFSASAHLRALQDHAQRRLIDTVVVNSATIAPGLKRKYAREKVKPVENDLENLTNLGVKVVTADLVLDSGKMQGKIRHDPAALASVVVDLASRSRAYQVRKAALSEQQLKTRLKTK
jgi:uncharacterized cofD-like protein